MEAIAWTVLQKLSSSAWKELGMVRNVEDDIEGMKSTVSAIKAVLLDAEAKATNLQISNWLEELKDVLYDADDLLDDVFLEGLKKKPMTGNSIRRRVLNFFSETAYGVKLGHRIKAIRKRLDDIAKNKHALQLSNHPNPMVIPAAYREQRQTYSFVSKDEVIGRAKEKRLLESYLLRQANATTDSVSIIPVVGIGGLGKTALAQLVYNDKCVQHYFEQTMWVCVSEVFDIRVIAQQMIGHDKNSKIEQVQQELRSKIQGKKYLLVLDDVWNEDRELWLKLKSLLMEGGEGSMVIVTTRSQTVAKIMGTHPPLFLNGLDTERSWKLFSQVVFDGGREPNDLELVGIGRDIVKKCAGVPLAIRTIGSLMYSRNMGRSDWLYFRDVEFSKIDEQKDKIFAILRLSYDHLPFFLKTCFAYCSLFPKGFVFDRKMLIQLWVAEGFIQPSGDNRCVEDVGNEYFVKLLSMCLFQDVTLDDCGDISTCKMHDLIHDLALLVVGKEYLALEEKIADIGNKVLYLSSRVPVQFVQASSYSYKLRTFLVFPQQLNGLDKSNFGSLLSLKCVRVLKICGLDIVTIPRSVKELKHLRYVDLSGNTQLVSLPRELTSLHNLQTLKLSQCSSLRELPADINKSLRHLELNYCDSLTCMPRGLGQLTSLQTLTHFVLNRDGGIGSLSELSELNNLRGKLHIRGLNSLQDNASQVEIAKVLIEKIHLHEVELQWRYDDIVEYGPYPPTMLIEDTQSLKDEMIIQGLQPHQSIKRLVINGFCGKRLPHWIGNLTSLLSLEISNCEYLRSLPDGIRNLHSLKSLCIYNCLLLEESCKRYGEDWQKIAHIPKVVVLPCTPSALRYFT